MVALDNDTEVLRREEEVARVAAGAPRRVVTGLTGALRRTDPRRGTQVDSCLRKCLRTLRQRTSRLQTTERGGVRRPW